MQHFILSAPNEQDLITTLPEYRSEDEWTNIIGPCTRWITKPTYDEEGNQTAPGETQPGFTLILYAELVPEAAQPYIITDATGLEPLPSGGLRTPPVPPVPQEVQTLQALLAIDALGYSSVYEAWANDPSRTFAEKAFRDFAVVWRRTNDLFNAFADAQGFTEQQKDDFFKLAATL